MSGFELLLIISLVVGSCIYLVFVFHAAYLAAKAFEKGNDDD